VTFEGLTDYPAEEIADAQERIDHLHAEREGLVLPLELTLGAGE